MAQSSAQITFHVPKITSQKSRLSSIFTQMKQRLALSSKHNEVSPGRCYCNPIAQVTASVAAVALADHTMHQLGHAFCHVLPHMIPHALHLLTTHKPVEEPVDLTPRDSDRPVHPGTPGCNNGFVMIGNASSFK